VIFYKELNQADESPGRLNPPLQPPSGV